METQYQDEFKRLQDYAERHGTQLTECFGFGQDGLVYATNRISAFCPRLRWSVVGQATVE